MDAVRASETSVNFNVTTRRYIPEDSKLRCIHFIANILWPPPPRDLANIFEKVTLRHWCYYIVHKVKLHLFFERVCETVVEETYNEIMNLLIFQNNNSVALTHEFIKIL
jgi:hypothetical protein